MNVKLIVLLALLFSGQLCAFSNFLENPYSPYPAGCATLPDVNTALYGNNVVTLAVPGRGLVLSDANNPSANQAVEMRIGRVLCSETNRSVVLIEFSAPSNVDQSDLAYLIRYVYVIYQSSEGQREHSMRLVAEPNSWGGSANGGGDLVFGGYPSDGSWGERRKWVFIVDNQSPFSEYFHGPESYMTAEQYNGAFELGIAHNHAPGEGWTVSIPATSEFGLKTPSIPLNGRLSGNWVAEGTRDQGFLISISELAGNNVPDPADLADSQLVFFMSWYTFAADGGMLWLSGNANFLPGDVEATFPIVMVKNGVFMGSKAADRTQVGSATITANSCNDLRFEYALSAIGLGSDVHRLKRIFSLETAGYACRDLEARIAAKNALVED